MRPCIACLVFLAVFGCHAEPRDGRVIVLGLDGLDPDAVGLLEAEGKLPNFARLRAGASARLRSDTPMLSPILWTTIATGRPPNEHKIGGFAAISETTGERLPVTSRMRKVPALWNLASRAGLRVGVVGWWATWPPEKVNGIVVSDHLSYHFLFEQGHRQSSAAEVVVYPPDRQQQIVDLARRPQDVGVAELGDFARISEDDLPATFSFDDPLSHLRWALAAAESHRAAALHIWERDQPDLLMLYVEGVDSISHLFGHLFRTTGLRGDLARQQQQFGSAVEAMYQRADAILGDVMARVDDDTTLVVLSDHGFALGSLHDDPTRARDLRAVSEKFHQIEGVLYLYGRAVRASSSLDQPQLLDVAPTVLSLLGLPVPEAMSGRVLVEGLEVDALGEPRPTGAIAAPESPASIEEGATSIDEAIMQRLASLGYVRASSPGTDLLLAAEAYESGDHERAARLYEELVAERPDDGGVRASLGGVLAALGRHDEALRQLESAIELAPLNPLAYHNRALLYERQGKVAEAVRDYRRALSCQADFNPSLQALQRLGEPRLEGLTEQQQIALRLAGTASVLARKGEYQGALAELEAAHAIAPELAVIHQYRANVAYLLGDLEFAERELTQALALKPGNPLYRHNLDQLRSGDHDRAPVTSPGAGSTNPSRGRP